MSNIQNHREPVKMVAAGPESARDAYLSKILQVLERLAARSPGSVGEIAGALDLEKSAVSRILTALAQRGYAEPTGNRGQYRIGVRVLLLAEPYLRQDPLINEAQPILRALALTARATAHLAVLIDEQMVIVAKEPSPEPIQVNSRVGGRMAAHSSALGKILLAGLPPEKRARFLKGPFERFTPKTVVDPRQLARLLDEVRRQGYAIEIGEENPGVGCISAPVVDPDGRWIAALSIAGPLQGTPFRTDRAHRDLVLRNARALSQRIALGAHMGE